MIDFTNVTDYDRSLSEMQEFLLFGISVAGKKSKQIAPKLDAFLEGRLPDETPFEYVRRLEGRGWLDGLLREARLSPYSQKRVAFTQVSGLDLATASVEELEAVPFIGPKTARFFVLHSRRDARVAVLDTHILAWLRELGHRAPRQTPANRATYRRLEDAFLAECDVRGLTPAELDLQIWVQRSGN